MPPIRIALLSDPHFYVAGPTSSADSHLPLTTGGEIDPLHRGVGKNPWDDLISLISTMNLSADLVLCAGDITCRGEPTALQAGWQFLGELGDVLGASLVSSATGNHDINSRSTKDKVGQNFVREASATRGPIEALKMLKPGYPVRESTPAMGQREVRTLQAKYFGESFVVVERERYRLLILNSCCEHGHDPHEYERGTIPESVLRWIKEDVLDADDGRVNLLLCHHPPQPFSKDGGSYDFMQRGDQLIEALDSSGTWLVLHGHKHLAQLGRAQSQTNRLSVIFSLASFAARLEAPFTSGKSNQFYIVDVDTDDDGRIHGTVRVWNWNANGGWRPAPPGEEGGVFDGCGFGCLLDPAALAEQIMKQFDSGTSDWGHIVTRVHGLKHAMPDTLTALRAKLKSKYKLDIECDAQGWYSSVVRTP